MGGNGNRRMWSSPAEQTFGQRSALPSMAGSLDSPGTAERTRRPAKDGQETKFGSFPRQNLQ